jgi:hypothetical protein
MSFTSTTWNMAQLVTISGVSDMDMVGESVAVTVRSAGMSSRTVAASVNDDDTQVVQMSTSNLTVAAPAP